MSDIEGHDIDGLEERLKVAIQDVKNLDDGLLEAVLQIIREPGWTSIAELTFAEAMTEAIIETAALLRRLQGGLEAGANRVARPGDPPPASA